MTYLTGAYPDREESRERDRLVFNFATSEGAHVVAVNETTIVQPVRLVRNQWAFPSCVGQTIAACVDATRKEPPWASAVSIWREARRRQGLIEVIELGTRLEYAIEGLIGRGWDPYREGEDGDEVEAGKGAPPAGDDLDDEMDADDNRQPHDIHRYRIIGAGGGVLDELVEALRRGWGVAIGTGLTDAFFSHVGSPDTPDLVLGLEHMSGSKNLHATRIFGSHRIDGRYECLLQNSWGEGWGGCHAPDGTWLPGCVWVDEDVIVGANDVHVVEVR
jgi:hypothetical protein